MVVSVGILPQPAAAQNPFTGNRASPPASSSSDISIASGIVSKISFWQFQVREKIAELVAEAKRESSLRPIAWLLVLAFAYGALHAAGPGHGKAVAFSYILSQKPDYRRGLFFGACLALVHGISGILFVLVAHGLLKLSPLKALGDITYVSQIVSYSLIIGLGLFILFRTVVEWRRNQQSNIADISPKASGRYLATAFAIGLIPCPGVVMVALFAVSMGFIGLGVILGMAISLGMALTITMVVTIAIFGKQSALQRTASTKEWGFRIEAAINIFGGLLVVVLGLIFLSASV